MISKDEGLPNQLTRFGKERMKQYCILFPPSLVDKIDAERGLIDRSVWIRDKLGSMLDIKLNEKGFWRHP
jgi:hypothetical protein